MTNEEFQAEVFRRSRVYLAKQQARRRRLFAGALAFAGCFAVVIAAAKLRPMTVKNAGDLSFQNAVPENYEAMDNAAGEAYDAESSEQACAEMNDDENGIIQGMTIRPSKTENEWDDEKCEETAEENDVNQAEEAPDASFFAEMTDSELFDYYGIKGLPETLAGMNYAGAENQIRRQQGQAGVEYFFSGAVSEDGNIFRYQDAAGEKQLYVLIQTMAAVHPQPEDMNGILAEDEDAKKVIFCTETLYVTVYADDLPFDTLKQAAQEMKDDLSQ